MSIKWEKVAEYLDNEGFPASPTGRNVERRADTARNENPGGYLYYVRRGAAVRAQGMSIVNLDFAQAELRVVAASSEHIIKLVAQLLPASRRWLEQKGYITQEYDALQLTPSGYAYFIGIYGSTQRK